MAKATGAREAQSQKIRAALINACIELLGDKPIDAITINNIVEKAGVAKGSFYNHFADKDALAATVSTAIRQEIEANVSTGNINVTDPAYRVSRGICYHIKLAVDDPIRATIMLRSHEPASVKGHPLNINAQSDIDQGVASGRFSTLCRDAGMVQLVGLTIATMLHIIDNQLTRSQAVDLSSQALTLTLCGFGVPQEEAARIALDSARDIIESANAPG